MNKVTLIGIVTKDLELKKSKASESIYTNFNLAIHSLRTKTKEEKTTFINIVAFGKQAEILCRYISKGSKLGVNGRLDVSSLIDEQGHKRYSTSVIVEEFQFLDNKKKISGESEIFTGDLTVPF
ncbi:single-strand DNA-binding protein [Clostridium cavendishii DSM 21758]|uniref:Single-stranded DNA-binding protein n=1 Tax=Clostridium cavendishii DSM 21758 TaxID=1121302 RepID=A0A1M6NTG0_9CLOT|nr:single-stranded DNA-binding protein [Clostridium cavendishii]SHJ98925.1 single-strand DNA-binding protein [Clostridium cavendishii DSM 21758]